jgi:hypothetical protein
MGRIRSYIPNFLTGIILCALVPAISHRFAPTAAMTQTTNSPAAEFYDIGTPTLTELWVSPTGNDANSGLTMDVPLRTLTAAWGKVPATLTSTGYRINLLPGTYLCEPGEPDNCQNYFTDRFGTYPFPLILRAYNGPGTATIRGGLDLNHLSYFYLMDVTLAGGMPLPTNNSGNNLLHLASVDHVLVRGVTLDGPDCAADTCNNLQEVFKVNQAQYLYVENSVIGGAWHSSVDYFAVQYGTFLNNEIHTAGQWCMYIKGGTSYLRIEGNNIHNCQLGFSAGQSANFPMMRAPWLHYEVYDIKFVNNLLHDLPGVGLGVAGGYNILFAYNTLYRVGTSTEIGYPIFEAVRGERGCDPTTELPNPLPTCNNYISQGGWGPNYVTTNVPAIPNRNVYVYNNIFYNPAPTQTQWTHFTILEPMNRPGGYQNIPNPVTTDDHLSIRGNVIWNGDASMPLGIEDTQACTSSNPTCNETQLRAENAINTVEPLLADPATGNYHPLESWTAGVTTFAIPDFIWDIASVPAGTNSNAVPVDYEGSARNAVDPPGAFHGTSQPRVISIQRADSTPTSAATVRFNVTFSEAMTGVDADDFQLTASGVSGAALGTVSGSGANYVISAGTGSANGTLRLDLLDNDSILDADLNPLGGVGDGNGNFTGGETYTIDRAIPALLAPLNATALHNNRPTFDWSDTAGAIGYNIQISRNMGFTQLVSNTNINTTTSTFTPATNLPVRATLFWRVRSKLTKTTLSGWSAAWTFQTANPPSVPALTSPTNAALVVGPSPLFNWNNSTVSGGAVFDHYQLQIASDAAFATPVNTVNVAGITNSQDASTVLPAGATYYWRVCAWNTAGDYSAWSTVRSVRIKYDPPTLSLPESGDIDAALKPTFSWVAVSGATSYTLQVSKSPSFVPLTINRTVTAPIFTATINLSAGTTYYWRVRVNGPYGPSGWSPAFSFTTIP